MAISGYGLIYTHSFTSTNGLRERFLIYEKDVSDNNTNIVGSSSPISTDRQSNADSANHYDITVGYEIVTFSTIASDSIFEYVDFASANEEKYLGVREQWNGVSWVEKFRGFQSPEYYFQDLYQTPCNVSVGFTDRLGDLQNYEFVNDDIFTSSIHDSTISQLDVINYCLNRLNLSMSGIRVTNRLMEASINSAVTDTALAQIYVDPYSYYDLDEDLSVTSSFSMLQVIDSILKPYSATLYAHGGYYWIIEQQEIQTGSAFSYVEYNMDGVYVSNSTYSDHIITFKTAGSSDFWRWAGRQSLTFTPVYKNVNLSLNGKIITDGLTPKFIGKEVFALGVLGFSSFGNPLISSAVSASYGNLLDSTIHGGRGYVTDEDRQVVYLESGPEVNQVVPDDETKLIWTFSFRDDDNTSTYIYHDQEITYTSGDKLNFTVKLQVRPTYSSGYTEPLIEWPYYIMPWQLKIGSYYYDFISGSWTTTNTTNQHFITVAGEDLEIEFNIPLRDTTETATYELDVYMPKRDEYDITNDTSESSMLTYLKLLTTTDLTVGNRKIVRYDENAGGGSFPVWKYYFYELLDNLDAGSEPSVVTPNDYNVSTNDKRWQLVVNKSIVNFSSSVAEVKGLDVQFLPKGKNPPESLISKTASNDNSVILKSELYHFDPPSQINNSDVLYYNILKYLSGLTYPATSSWSDGSLSLPIQNHRLNWLVANSNLPRHRIQGGKIYHDVDVPPFVALLDVDRNNRVYRMTSASINHSDSFVGGDFVEIGSDTVITFNAFSNGFSKAFS